MRARRRRFGVTLLELLVVVIVIGILAAIALPNLGKTVEQGQKRQALDILMAIYTGERSHYFYRNTKAYVTLGPRNSNLEWRQIGMDNPNTLGSTPVVFDVTVNATIPPTFVARADRGGGKTITIDEDRDIICGGGWTIPCP